MVDEPGESLLDQPRLAGSGNPENDEPPTAVNDGLVPLRIHSDRIGSA